MGDHGQGGAHNGQGHASGRMIVSVGIADAVYMPEMGGVVLLLYLYQRGRYVGRSVQLVYCDPDDVLEIQRLALTSRNRVQAFRSWN